MARDKVICPYCGKEAEFMTTEEFYGADYGTNMYVCESCDAYVGTHGRSENPLGTLANHRLRNLRKMAHRYFDPIWRKKKMPRSAAYEWLSNQMNIPKDECHIGAFNEEQCEQVVNIMSDRDV